MSEPRSEGLRWRDGSAAGAAPAYGKRAEGTDATPLLDPYVRWAEATHWNGFAAAAAWPPGMDERATRWLHVIARAPSPEALQQLLQKEDELGDGRRLHVSAAYGRPVPGTGQMACHFTARLRLSDLAWLQTQPYGLVWELAMPMRNAQSEAESSPHGYWGRSSDTRPFAVANPFAPVIARLPERPRPRGIGPAIAVIDSGCPTLNRRFADAGGTRIAALWDQGGGTEVPPDKATGWPWRQPARFDYGRELGPAELKAMYQALHASPLGASIDEAAGYRGIDHLIAYRDPRRRVWLATHGAHVLDVAGGTVDPLKGAAEASPGALPAEAADEAGRAALVFVQLPADTAADSSGGSLSAHLLDALRYVLDVTDPEQPLVVNISYGTFAGPHDGQSLVESALAELLQLRPRGWALVLAAGNAHEAGCHVRRRVQREKTALLRIDVVPGDTTDSFVEIWYPAPPGKTRLEARVRCPDGNWSDWVGPGSQQELCPEGGSDVVALLRNDTHVPGGGRALVLLALAPTAMPEGVPLTPAQPGVWELEFRLAGEGREREVVIDAWIERDDGADGGSRQSTFFGVEPADADETLSSLATTGHAITVGGFRRSDGEVAAYSSEGHRFGDPAETPLPAIYAACEESADEPGFRAAAVRSDESVRMNGTSVAAPVLARRLFNLMNRNPVDRSETPAEGFLSPSQALARLADECDREVRRR